MYGNKNIFLNLTYKCNAFCKKCMTRYHRNKDQEMDIDLLRFIISKLKSNHYSNVVSMGAGETLLYKYCTEAIQKLLEVNDSIRLRILTNGMALNDSLPDFYFNQRVIWGITMDGFFQQDLLNIQRGVDIETVKNNVKKIVSRFGPDSIYLNYTLYRTNYDSLVNFFEFAADLSVKSVYVTRLRVFEGYENRLKDLSVVNNEHFYSIKESIRKIANRAGIECKGIDIEDDFFERQCYKRNRTMPIIDVDGSLSFCCGREDVYIGNIQDENIEAKWSNLLNQLNTKTTTWCNGCGNCALADGRYRLPKTINLKDCPF